MGSAGPVVNKLFGKIADQIPWLSLGGRAQVTERLETLSSRSVGQQFCKKLRMSGDGFSSIKLPCALQPLFAQLTTKFG